MESLRKSIKKNLPVKLQHFLRVLRDVYLAPQEKELTWLRSQEFHFDIAIDIGAFQGLYSSVLSRVSQKVLAFEPVREQSRYLDVVLPENCTVFNLALSETNRIIKMRIPTARDGSHLFWLATVEEENQFQDSETSAISRRQVTCRKLDDFLKDNELTGRVDFIKIDVEGHEYAVLKGAALTLETHQPMILLEAEYRHGADIPEILSYLESKNYKMRILGPEGLEPISVQQLERAQKENQHNSKAYINNLIFLPENRSNISRKFLHSDRNKLQ